MAGPLVGMSAFVCDENRESWVITQVGACQSQGHDDMSSLLCRGKKQCAVIDKVGTKTQTQFLLGKLVVRIWDLDPT